MPDASYVAADAMMRDARDTARSAYFSIFLRARAMMRASAPCLRAPQRMLRARVPDARSAVRDINI